VTPNKDRLALRKPPGEGNRQWNLLSVEERRQRLIELQAKAALVIEGEAVEVEND